MGNVDLKFYLSIFLRRLPYFIVIAAFLSAVGIAVASILPPVYRSTASILVEDPQIPDDLARSTVPINPIEQIQIIEQRLMTRANILSLADRFGIYADQPGIPASAIIADMRGRTQLVPVTARRGPGATIIEVSFASEEPQEAAEITNELVTLILQENVSLRTGRAEDTLDFFEGEVGRLSGEIDRISQRMMSFKAENENALPDSLAFRRSQQAILQERLLQYEREATSLQDERERTVDIYERTGRVAADTDPGSPEERDLAALQSDLTRARVIYSANNPKIRLLETRIAGLEKIVAEQRAAAGGDTEGLSDYEARLAEIDGRVAFIDEEKARIDAELDALEASIQATPANELVLGEMQRDYRNVQGQYNAAVDRLATASVGERLEVMAKGERFSLIEPAVAPSAPDEPNRVLIAGAGVAGGIGAGIGFILLMELLNRSIRRPSELSSQLGIQPFATIPYMRTRRELRIKRTIMLIVLALIVVGIPMVLFAIHTYYLPLDLLMRQAADKIGLGGMF
jgi:polysaccharide chain length determinant protein (PEP-CTERM system associated)